MDTKSNTRFCHYTSVENARNILNSESIFLSRFDTMNDLAEAKLHKKDSRRVFALSLCHSNALNIPLFYLYGGIDGKGCRIQFTRAKLQEILKECTVSGVNKQSRKIKTCIPPSEYEILNDWIYYISSDGTCFHKNNKKKYKSYDDAVNSLRVSNKHFFVKNPIWKFENEFRLAVVFKKDIPYDRVAINFRISDNERGISVFFGPETTEEEFTMLTGEFLDYRISKTDKTSERAVSMRLASRNRTILERF